MLPTDEEARHVIIDALYGEKRRGRGGLSFDQLHDKLFIPWPILWYNLDYLEEEQLIIHQKQEVKTSDDSSTLPSTYELSEKGQNVMEHKEAYTEKYPFLTLYDNESEER